MARVGVLALQGGFAAHATALGRLGHEVVLVRVPADMPELDGLVLPGGESTAQQRAIDRGGLAPPLNREVRRGLPLLATCAGLILAARHVSNPVQASFGWLDVAVARNAWGRQVDSFEARSDAQQLPLVLIRAPRIIEIGPSVQVLATFEGEPVLVRQGRVIGATFHPELTTDLRVHRAVFGTA